MKLTINTKKFTLTDDLSDRIASKLKKLDKFFGDDAEARIFLTSGKNFEQIEITIYDKGTMFRAEVKDDTALNALDRAITIIERQIRKNKTRLEKRLRQGAFDKTAPIGSDADENEEEIKITRVKRFVIKPMTPEEAVLQMNLLGHEFFIFNNAETGTPCVAYKKKNNEYGVIEGISE